MATQTLSAQVPEPGEFAHTNPAFSTARSRLKVSIFDGVFMLLRAVSLSRFPVGSIGHGVLLILTGRAPVQVFKAIVIPIVVAMKSPLPLRPRANEARKHEGMNGSVESLAVATQDDLPVPPSRPPAAIFGRLSSNQHPSAHRGFTTPPIRHGSILGPNTATIRCFVAGKVDNRQPRFLIAHAGNRTSLQGVPTP